MTRGRRGLLPRLGNVFLKGEGQHGQKNGCQLKYAHFHTILLFCDESTSLPRTAVHGANFSFPQCGSSSFDRGRDPTGRHAIAISAFRISFVQDSAQSMLGVSYRRTASGATLRDMYRLNKAKKVPGAKISMFRFELFLFSSETSLRVALLPGVTDVVDP